MPRANKVTPEKNNSHNTSYTPEVKKTAKKSKKK